MRGSSVHFKRISSAIHAVSHASREVPPEYLLPQEHSLGTHVVIDDNGQVQKLLEHKMNLASRQAKATKNYSPLWEGVINLPEPSKNITPVQQIEIVKQWCKEYEAMTGHKVIRADVHLDEGFVDEAGKPHYNAHAHVMCDRTDDKGKVKKLTSTVLREVQNMTSEVTTLQRGLDARTTGRKHIGHHNFKFDAEKNRLGLDKEKSKIARLQKLFAEDTLVINGLKKELSDSNVQASKQANRAARLARLKDQYRLDREALKASGTAKQADYQALKTRHEAALAEIENLTKKVETMAQENQTLKAENARLEAKHHDRLRDDLLDKAAKIREQVASGEKSDTLLVTAVGHELAASKIAKIAQEATEAQTHPTPSPKPEKSLAERLAASMRVFLDWVKGKGGVQEHVGPSTRHDGPVVQLDDLHCVQRTGRTQFAIHELSKLDRVPVQDDPKTEIQYRDGVGQVKGQSLGKGGLGD